MRQNVDRYKFANLVLIMHPMGQTHTSRHMAELLTLITMYLVKLCCCYSYTELTADAPVSY